MGAVAETIGPATINDDGLLLSNTYLKLTVAPGKVLKISTDMNVAFFFFLGATGYIASGLCQSNSNNGNITAEVFKGSFSSSCVFVRQDGYVYLANNKTQPVELAILKLYGTIFCEDSSDDITNATQITTKYFAIAT